MNKEYVDLQVSGSDWSYGSKWGDQMEDSIINWFSLDLKLDSRILDAGCGEGRGLIALRDRGFINLTGVDLSEEKLSRAREKNLNVLFTDIHNLPFKDNSFNYCFSSHTLEHMINIKKAISSLLRVSNKLYYIVPIFETIEFVKLNNPSHINPINNPKEFIKHLDELGVKHQEKIHHRLCPELWGIVER